VGILCIALHSILPFSFRRSPSIPFIITYVLSDMGSGGSPKAIAFGHRCDIGAIRLTSFSRSVCLFLSYQLILGLKKALGCIIVCGLFKEINDKVPFMCYTMQMFVY
jgi:hypothetical protein